MWSSRWDSSSERKWLQLSGGFAVGADVEFAMELVVGAEVVALSGGFDVGADVEFALELVVGAEVVGFIALTGSWNETNHLSYS